MDGPHLHQEWSGPVLEAGCSQVRERASELVANPNVGVFFAVGLALRRKW